MSAAPGTTRAAEGRHVTLAIVALALAFRLAFIAAAGANAPPTSWGDDWHYDEIATRLVTEHRYVNQWFPPGYPVFLAAVYGVVGRNLVVVRLLQAVLGALACFLTIQVGTRLFSRPVGLVAGLVLALYPGHMYMSWRIMGETLYITMMLAAVLAALVLAERPRVLGCLGLGLLLGAANLVKSNLFPFPLLVATWFAFATTGPRARRFAGAAAILAGVAAAAVVTPIANYVASGGEAAALPGNTGHTLWWSNNPAANGYFKIGDDDPPTQAFIARHGMTDRLARADPFERDRIYRDLALAWITEDPWRFVVLCGRKLDNAFGIFPEAASFEGSPATRVVHVLTYGVLAPFALAGMLLSRRRWRALGLPYLAIASYVLMVVVFYGTPRFTIVVMPYLVLFASAALTPLAVRAADRLGVAFPGAPTLDAARSGR